MTPAAPTLVDERTGADRWRFVRLALLGVALLLGILTVVFGQRGAPFDTLESAVSRGEVHVVHVAGDLRAGVRGYSQAEVTWRQGWRSYRCDLTVAVPLSRAPDDGSDVIGRRITPDLESRHAGVRVVSVERSHSSADIVGLRLPDWLTWSLLALTVAIVVLVARGPTPLRATRWAWFWLLGPAVAIPFGTVVVLALMGPTPPLRTPPPETRRLHGAWAFLVALVLNSVLHSH